MSANIKIRCKLNDLLRVLYQQCGIRNIAVESGDDVDGLVNTLLGVLNFRYTRTKQGFSSINGSDVTIHLFSKHYSDCFEDSGFFDKKERQGVVDRIFAQEVKRLQRVLDT